MSIYNDIKKVTQIPHTQENALFIQKGPNKPKQSRKLIIRNSPQNVNLYDFDTVPDIDKQLYNNKLRKLHDSEIASSIKQFSGNYTNEMIEKTFKTKQATSLKSSYLENNLSLAKTNYNCSTSSAEANNKISISVIKFDEKKNIEVVENILKRCKLNKNAAIIGLLKSHKISLSDLQMPSDSVRVKDKSDINIQNGNVSPSSDLTEEMYKMELVQCPEDPEVLVHPLQACGNIDENKYKDIDFTVPHLGKKKIVTSQQFYVKMEDSNIDFVKKDMNRKMFKN